VARLDLQQALVVGLALLLVLAPALGVGVVEVAAQGQGNGGGPSNGNGGGPSNGNGGGPSNGNGGGPSNGNGGGPPAHAGPPDHAGVPGSNVEVQGPPSGGGPPDHAAAWGVRSSAHSDDLSVTIEASNGLTVTLTDDRNSAGREVSMNASAVEQALGERPQVAYGVNSESGERWSSEVRYENGSAVISVPHFSTNTVTFSGSVSVLGTFSDGETATYSLGDLDSASDAEITLTGAKNTAWDNETATLPAGGSTAIDPGGNIEPTGPSTGEPQLEITAQEAVTEKIPDSDTQTVTFNDPPTATSATAEVYIKSTENAGGTDANGNVEILSDGTVIASKSFEVLGGYSKTITFEGIDLSSTNDLTYKVADTNYANLPRYNAQKVIVAPDSSPTVETNDGDSIQVSGLTSGSTATEAIDLSTDASSLSVDATQGVYQINVSIKEATVTKDASVTLNGEQVAYYNGTLSQGESASFTANASHIAEGKNTINTSLGSGSLSSGSPPLVVQLSYTHESSDQVSIDHTSNTWQESFNVSRTYENETDDASITTSLADNVISIETAEYRVDGGAWSTISDYSLDGSTFSANFPTLSPNSTLQVRVTARKVQPENGDIIVDEPTVEGDTLDTLITVQNPSSGFGIDVSNTSQSDRLHYAANPSYEASDYSTLGPDGSQVIRMPEASDGSQARIRTAPISLNPEGEVEAVVVDADEPRFSIREGNASGASVVGITYYDTVAGERYVLHSETRDRDVDADRAESPVSFQASGADATYTILQQDGSGGAAVVSIGDESSGLPLGIIALVGSISVGMVGLAYAGRRLGISGARSTLVLLVGGVVLGFIGVEAVTARSVLSDLVFAIGQALGRTGSGFATSGIGSILLSVGGLLGLWLLDRATGWVPTWLIWVSGAGLSIYTVESIAPGTLTSGLTEVSPLLWLLGGLAVVVFLWRRSAGPSITVVGGDGDE